MATLEAVDHDPFASSGGTVTIPGQNGEPTRVIMNMGSGPKLEPVDHDPFEGEATDYGGLAKATGVGVAKGTIGLAGLAGDAQALVKKGVDYVASKLPAMPEPDPESLKYAKMFGGSGDLGPSFPLPSSADIQGLVEKVTGPFRKPQNQKEEDAQTVGEFLPAAALGPGGMVRKAVTQAAIPSTATIIAGRYSDQNPYVKALAGFVAGGIGALSGPGSAEQILRSKLPASVTEHDITRAGQLIDHAQQRGVALTWPEALTRVTGQPLLTDTQRILESHGQTRPHMEEFFAGRPAAVENAARGEFNQVGNVHPNPSSVGHEASEAAGGVLNNIRGSINRAAEPFYQASENIRLTPAEMSHVRAIPGWTEARDAVRNNEQLNWRVAHLPDDSVGFLNEVKKYFHQAQENASSTFAQNRNQQVASTHGMAEDAVRQIAIAKSEEHALRHGGGPNTYEAALGIESRTRQQYLEPLLRGPLGKIADQPDTKKAINALFQTNPLPGSEGEVRNAVFAIARQRPAVAEQLVRAHAEMVFNEAARELQGGANQFAGAKFAKVIAGNSQQRTNLQAAIEALPHGNARWEGFEHLLDIMSATGARQPKGSLTAFNQLEVQSMSSSGLTSLAAKGASPSKWMSFANDAFKAWSLGRNLDQLARIITNPRSGDALRQIVRIPPGTDRALAATGRLIVQLGASTTDQRAKPN